MQRLQTLFTGIRQMTPRAKVGIAFLTIFLSAINWQHGLLLVGLMLVLWIGSLEINLRTNSIVIGVLPFVVLGGIVFLGTASLVPLLGYSAILIAVAFLYFFLYM